MQVLDSFVSWSYAYIGKKVGPMQVLDIFVSWSYAYS